MINPFITNNDHNLLFRKNYQIINKPALEKNYTPFSSSSANKIEFLQNRNPFAANSNANNSIYISQVNLNQSRSLSVKPTFNNNSQSRALLGKSRLLDDADGWKKQLQNKQREKLQAYGVEGLRYNAYTSYQPKQQRKENVETEYYGSTAMVTSFNREIIVKPKIYNQKQQPHHDTKINFYSPSPERQNNFIDSAKMKKNSRQIFRDQINEDDFGSNTVKNWKDSKPKFDINLGEDEEVHRHSNLKDMFESAYDQRFKKSMQHNSYASYYGAGDQEDLLQSKHDRMKQSKSKFQRDAYNSSEANSSVRKVEIFAPNSISVFGKIYQKIQL